MIYDDIQRRTEVRTMAQEERTEVIMVRVTARDKKAFEAAAEELDMKVSEFVRAATLMYLAVTVNPYALKSLAKGAAESIRETMRRLREPGLRKAFWSSNK
jgi:mobilization protein NikA